MLARYLLMLIFCCPMMQAGAHNPNHAAVVIKEVGEEWTIEVSFASHGLQGMLESFNKDSSFVLDNGNDTKDLFLKYVLERLEITLNRHKKLSFSAPSFQIDDHGSTMILKIDDVPPRAEFWHFDIGFNNENESLRTVIQFNVGDHTSKYAVGQDQVIQFRQNDTGFAKLQVN
ncbi:MAG: hypothetical protein MRY83_06875 [Flavobacteriales bacterium]|nr:hypothetical protein [Flavobacteriales bacterium]